MTKLAPARRSGKRPDRRASAPGKADMGQTGSLARWGPMGVVGVILLTAGCTWQQAYSASQAWQRNACNRLVEQTERERCLGNASMSYEDYRRRGEAKKD